jgi:hypothetical protein
MHPIGMEFYSIFLEKHIQVALKMFDMGIVSSFFPKLTRVFQRSSSKVIVLARKEAYIHVLAFQIMPEHFFRLNGCMQLSLS